MFVVSSARSSHVEWMSPYSRTRTTQICHWYVPDPSVTKPTLYNLKRTLLHHSFCRNELQYVYYYQR